MDGSDMIHIWEPLLGNIQYAKCDKIKKPQLFLGLNNNNDNKGIIAITRIVILCYNFLEDSEGLTTVHRLCLLVITEFL